MVGLIEKLEIFSSRGFQAHQHLHNVAFLEACLSKDATDAQALNFVLKLHTRKTTFEPLSVL